MVSHTTTGEWQSFEARMRRRRAERLVLRAEAAAAAGCLEDAHRCLAEARALAPGLPALDSVEQRLSAPALVEDPPATRGKFAARALMAVAATGAVVWWALVAWPPTLARDPVATADASVVSPQPSASTPVEDRVPAEPLPAPIERFALEIEAARPDPPRTETPPPMTASAPALGTTLSALPVMTPAPAPPPPAPLPQAEVTPLTPAVAESIRMEVSTIADRTSEPPVSRVGPTPVRTGASDAAATAPAPAPPPSQEPAVRAVLDRYASAFSSLDVEAAQRVWPGVNRGALARAFDNLETQHVSLGDCRIDIGGQTATAQCAGTMSWSPKVGDGGTRTESRSWTFELTRGSQGWEIVSARVQNR